MSDLMRMAMLNAPAPMVLATLVETPLQTPIGDSRSDAESHRLGHASETRVTMNAANRERIYHAWFRLAFAP